MTQPGSIESLVTAGVGDAGLVKLTPWQLRPATVVIAGDVSCMGLFAGEGVGGEALTNVPLISLVGYVPVNTRVTVLTVPPSGNYIIAKAYGTSDSAWVEYTPVLSSSGAQPDVGDGYVRGRWLIVGHQTLAVEVATLWGAGRNQGTGRYFWSAPFSATERARQAATGACYMLDTGTANRAGIVNITSGLDQYFVTNTPNGDVGQNVPNQWDPGDEIRFSITHEILLF